MTTETRYNLIIEENECYGASFRLQLTQAELIAELAKEKSYDRYNRNNYTILVAGPELSREAEALLIDQATDAAVTLKIEKQAAEQREKDLKAAASLAQVEALERKEFERLVKKFGVIPSL